MTAEIKVLSTIQKLTKDGRPYREVWFEIKFEENTFVIKRVLFY